MRQTEPVPTAPWSADILEVLDDGRPARVSEVRPQSGNWSRLLRHHEDFSSID